MSHNAQAVASGGQVEQVSNPVGDDPPDALNAGAANNPGEQQTVTGISSQLPAYIYMHYIFLSSFSWDSTQKQGTVIWKIPLHPHYMNPIISYLSYIFNIWAGSMNFKFVVAGTGFNGGKLVLCWIPPNINVDDLDLAGKTMFSFGMIDPKNTDPIPINCRDQRIQKAHWMTYAKELDESNLPYLDKYATIGGSLVLVVMNPLVSSSMDKATVNLSVLNCAGMDFTMSQFRPPKLGEKRTTIRDIHFADKEYMPGTNKFHVDTLHADPVEFTTSADVALLRFTNDGEYARFPTAPRLEDIWFAHIDYKKAAEFGYKSEYYPNPTPAQEKRNYFHRFALQFPNVDNMYQSSFYTAGSGYVESAVLWLSSRREDVDHYVTTCVVDSDDTPDLSVTPFFGKVYEQGIKNRPSFKPVGQAGQPVDDSEKISSDIGEHIVLFGFEADDPGCGTPTTATINEWLGKGYQTSQDLVFAVTDKISELPLLIIRLNKGGFWTCRPIKKRVNIELSKVYLKYMYQTDHHAKLPQSPAGNLAIYLASVSHDKITEMADTIERLKLAIGSNANELEDFAGRWMGRDLLDGDPREELEQAHAEREIQEEQLQRQVS